MDTMEADNISDDCEIQGGVIGGDEPDHDQDIEV